MNAENDETKVNTNIWIFVILQTIFFAPAVFGLIKGDDLSFGNDGYVIIVFVALIFSAINFFHISKRFFSSAKYFVVFLILIQVAETWFVLKEMFDPMTKY